MVASADRSNFSIAFPKKRIVPTDVKSELIRTGCIRISKIESVPQNSFRLPGLYIFQLFRKTLGIGRCRESFVGKYGGGGMMTMSTFPGRGKTRNDDIGLEFSYHPHNIA